MTDRGNESPEVETQRIVRWIRDPTTLHPHSAEVDASERPVRPTLRPIVPVLTALDDGTFGNGENFRLRGERFLIGRNEGDITIPGDRTLSARHAEIRRVESRGKISWLLVDLDTANGTFVRIKSAPFFPDTIIILGGRRYRLVHPMAEQGDENAVSTVRLDKRAGPLDLWPTLTETGLSTTSLKFQLQTRKVTVGRLGGGSTITIDDPHLAAHHATISQSAEGAWRIQAGKTENGVWANVRSVVLTPHCYFRCGEQFFRFIIP